MTIRPAAAGDFPAVLALNAESVRFLSPLTLQRLVQLHREAALHLVVDGPDGIAAFLLAFRERAAYDSVNYRWFDQRYARFLYVDRLVVAPALQGTGIGSRLYRQVFETARRDEVPCVTCEFDVDPPNPVSERFHARFGFEEVGRQEVAGGNKTVSLQVAPGFVSHL